MARPPYRDQRRGKDRHDRRVGTHDQFSRGAKEGVGHQRSDAGVNSGFRRQARDCRISDGAWQADRRHCQPGCDIVSDPARLIAGKAREEGKVKTHRWHLFLLDMVI